jgi:cell division protein FtsA
LAGLCLYAAEDPVDIRSVGAPRAIRASLGGARGSLFPVGRMLRAMKEYF